jgi:hypothetical protein
MSLDLLRNMSLDIKVNKIEVPFIVSINPAPTLKVNGTETLVAGTVTVATAAVTPQSFILLMRTSDPTAANVGTLAVRNIVDGVSFDIVSSDVLDVGDISYVLIYGFDL